MREEPKVRLKTAESGWLGFAAEKALELVRSQASYSCLILQVQTRVAASAQQKGSVLAQHCRAADPRVAQKLVPAAREQMLLGEWVQPAAWLVQTTELLGAQEHSLGGPAKHYQARLVPAAQAPRRVRQIV